MVMYISYNLSCACITSVHIFNSGNFELCPKASISATLSYWEKGSVVSTKDHCFPITPVRCHLLQRHAVRLLSACMCHLLSSINLNFLPIIPILHPQLSGVSEESDKTLIRRVPYLNTPVILNRSHLLYLTVSPSSSSSWVVPLYFQT